MSKVCSICGKRPQTGNSISHSHVRNKRRWMPNLQVATVSINGIVRKLKVCTRCKRTNAI